ncbi:MAG: ferredoxin [Rubrivivax sp. SCN 71-131]|nr:MAG: ferredoxin [Rubrivivax sp. SCN 71-131]
MKAAAAALAALLADALPQTQCRRCGFADCDAYAQAMAEGGADLDRCPPGGAEGIARLARLSGLRPRPLDPSRGREGPRGLAVIDEAACIGCTLCIQACPVDCIVGAPKRMHAVIDDQCTGCELCVPACPVDCIAMQPVSGARSGWQAWSEDEAHSARARYAARRSRQARAEREHDERLARHAARTATATATLAPGAASPGPAAAAATAPPATQDDRRRAAVEAALARARAQRSDNRPQ